jgi:hypothetical protein
MLIAIWPLIICIAGLVIYLLASNSKAQEIGRIMFFVGLFWTAAALVQKTLHVAALKRDSAGAATATARAVEGDLPLGEAAHGRELGELPAVLARGARPGAEVVQDAARLVLGPVDELGDHDALLGGLLRDDLVAAALLGGVAAHQISQPC